MYQMTIYTWHWYNTVHQLWLNILIDKKKSRATTKKFWGNPLEIFANYLVLSEKQKSHKEEKENLPFVVIYLVKDSFYHSSKIS